MHGVQHEVHFSGFDARGKLRFLRSVEHFQILHVLEPRDKHLDAAFVFTNESPSQSLKTTTDSTQVYVDSRW